MSSVESVSTTLCRSSSIDFIRAVDGMVVSTEVGRVS